MLSVPYKRIKQSKWFPGRYRSSAQPAWKRIFGTMLLLIVINAVLLQFNLSPAEAHHGPRRHLVETTCFHVFFSANGNPFPLCPGPYPRGGDCTWWVWEQWHLLGYNLPTNWGSPVVWVADATHAGLSVGTTPRIGSIAVFPRGDGVWAFGPEGHVAFVTAVTNGGTTFNVTYQDYGDPTPMYVGTGYNVSVINERRFQDGLLRFIYFPRPMVAQLFWQLPGIGG
jgi:hypothetical protein